MKRFLITIAIVIALYLTWALYGRTKSNPYEYKNIPATIQINHPEGISNIVGIQPYMTSWDYMGAQSFYAKMEYYFEEANKAGLLNKNTTVALPEHLGTWLVAAGEKQSVYSASSIEAAMRITVFSNLFNFVYYYSRSGATDKVREAIFQMKAKRMAAIYNYTFSRLARNYEVAIVPGSIVLPKPVVTNGEIKTTKGALFNTSMVFNNDGTVDQNLTLKQYPIEDELTFISPSGEDLPIYEVPSGKTSILICADAWYPESYRQVVSNGVNTIIVPAYSAGDGLWDTKWKGYNGAEQPQDIDIIDIEKITEGEAWHKYTLSRFAGKGNIAISVFLRGEIWDLGTDGESFVYINNEIKSVEKTEGPQIFNVWFY